MNITEDECYCDEMDYGPFSPRCPVCTGEFVEKGKPPVSTRREYKKPERANMSYCNYHNK